MKKKILIVDDEERIVSTLTEYFQNKGYDVFSTTSGEEAIRIVEREPLDLVLLDMKMPGIDGPQVLKKIRSTYFPARVIAVTGYAKEYEEAIREAGGVDGILIKPVPLKELTSKVEEVLSSIPSLGEDFEFTYERMRELLKTPPLEPSKEKISVKLLFLEKSSEIYDGLSLHFSKKLKFNEEYKLCWAHTPQKAFIELESFRPDIVLIDYQNFSDCGRLATEFLNSSFRPKEVIIYGAALEDRIKEIETQGVRALDLVFVDPKRVDRLIQTVRDIALKYRLIKE